jgi:type IV pilus assembly protein PilN
LIKINLIKEEGSERYKFRIYFTGYVASMIFIFLVCIFYIQAKWNSVSELEGSITNLKIKVGQLKNKTKNIDHLEEEKNSLKEKLFLIAKLKKSKSGPVKILDKINTSLPNESWLEEIIEQDSYRTTIQGTALDDESIAVFASDLESSEYFKDVVIAEMVQQGDKNSTPVKKFKITTILKYEGDLPIIPHTETLLAEDKTSKAKKNTSKS